MPPRKPWWLLNDEQAWKNLRKPTARKRAPAGMVVRGWAPPKVTRLPTPWSPYVPPQGESEFDPVIRKRKRPHKKQVSASQIVDEVDALVTAGKSLGKARSQIAKKYKREFFSVERMHQRAKKKQARK